MIDKYQKIDIYNMPNSQTKVSQTLKQKRAKL